MENNFPIFDRLIGLETEYALRWHSEDGSVPANTRQYELLMAEVRQLVLTAPARHFKTGLFTANGGAFWFEAETSSPHSGLVEGSTPECRGPRQTILYQRAQDTLLQQASHAVSSGQLRLLKNSRDSRGNVYGAQENYEAVLARGWRLAAWRAGLIALLPVAALTWLTGFCLFLLVLLAVVFAATADMVAEALGRTISWQRIWPTRRADALLLLLCRVLTSPLAAGLILLSHGVAFAETRRKLLPFLVSRAVFTGAGLLDDDGRFQLADKAPDINATIGFVGFLNDRPIFTFGHFFKALCLEACFSPRAYTDLFQPRQRLQIGLGDSNMCPAAELLRVGTTLLVLDAIEAGYLDSAPVLKHPIEALHGICRDPSLTREVACRGLGSATALDLQHFYLSACEKFLRAHPDAPEEAWGIWHRWSRTLALLEADPESLLGEIDWITKRRLIEEAGRNASWEVKKKIDLKYHELSPEGYFHLLAESGAVEELLEPAELEKAVRNPPPDSPATTRGRYLREFSGAEYLAVHWKFMIIRVGKRSKVIKLTQFGRSRKQVEADPETSET